MLLLPCGRKNIKSEKVEKDEFPDDEVKEEDGDDDEPMDDESVDDTGKDDPEAADIREMRNRLERPGSNCPYLIVAP